jgi:uncharacterized membrane protein
VSTPERSVASAQVPASVSQNIETIEQFYQREQGRVRGPQRLLERIAHAIGRPFFLAAIGVFVLLWILANVLAVRLGWQVFDPPPFPALQGIVSLAALLSTLVVLIGQNRLAKLEQRREHLELQVNILTEQKTTKLIHLLEELRHDLPMVRDRVDPDVAALKQPADAKQILSALEDSQRGASADDPRPK